MLFQDPSCKMRQIKIQITLDMGSFIEYYLSELEEIGNSRFSKIQKPNEEILKEIYFHMWID